MRYFRYPLLAVLILATTMFACGRGSREDTDLAAERPTLRPTFTATLPATDTPIPPTSTVPPTATPVPPTDTPPPTPTDTPQPSATPVPATETPEPPTETPRPTRTPGPPTDTPVPPTATRPPILLQSSFDGGLDDGWQPFLNYWRLREGQWYWSAEEGVDGSGAIVQRCCSGEPDAEDALMMYLGDGALEWTDYRVEAQFIIPTDNSQKQGLWVRGQYEPREMRAQWVTGYYVILEGKRRVRLLQLQTADDCVGGACANPPNQYAFNNPYLLQDVRVPDWELTPYDWHTLAVEVRGNKISVWVDGKFALEHVDGHVPFLKGTVGMKTYKSKPTIFDNVIVKPLD